MLIVFGGQLMLHIIIQKNTTCLSLLGWAGHNTLNSFFYFSSFNGILPCSFFICDQIKVLYQFWVHTKYIRKLSAPIEFIFVKPSHHSVHHSTNDKYLDKNFESTFII